MKNSIRKQLTKESFQSSLSTDSENSPQKCPKSMGIRRSFSMLSNELSNARIIQSKLVYIKNLPESASTEETLRSAKCFGQYGTITKCVGNKSPQHPAYQAYITYSSEEEAAVCIKACNKFILDENELLLTYGTTKYCNYFLKGNACPKAECLYLHGFVDESNIVPRDFIPHTGHIQVSNSIFDGLKVVVAPPSNGFMLPVAKIIRDRAFSEQIFSQRDKSRFDFTEDGDETAVPPHFEELRKLSFPKDEISEIPIVKYKYLLSQLQRDYWLVDVLKFELREEKVLVYSK